MKIANYLFRDRTGSYVVGQAPNVPMYMVLISLICQLIFRDRVSLFILQASVFLWSYLELRYGESRFRNILGLLVMSGTIILVAVGP